MKHYYDQSHKPQYFEIGEFVRLCLHRGYKVPQTVMQGLNRKLQRQYTGPFCIIGRVGQLAYRIELPPTWRIHNVVSIAHLEPTPDLALDPYNRVPLPPPPVEVDGETE